MKSIFKYNHPEATLIIYGTLELSGDKIHSHIHAKNLVITPTGTLILENAQLLIEENLKNFGNLILTHSVCHAKYTVIGFTFLWLNLRQQLTSYANNEDQQITVSNRINTANSLFQEPPAVLQSSSQDILDSEDPEWNRVLSTVD